MHDAFGGCFCRAKRLFALQKKAVLRLYKGSKSYYTYTMQKPPILSITGMSLPELEALCASMKEPVYRAKQILSWVYEKGATTFDRMSNLPKSFRTEMEKKRSLFQTRVDAVFRTDDNSEKFLIHLSDGNLIESVLLREGKRITACVSSQVGCAMACRFCASGLWGWKGPCYR